MRFSTKDFTHFSVSKNHRVWQKSGAFNILMQLLISLFLFITATSAQLVTVGGGILTSERPPEAVMELHAASSPILMSRAYITASWTELNLQPTLITAVERTIFQMNAASTGLGMGLLWPKANNYRPFPMIVSSSMIPLPVPRSSLVIIASTLPFEQFDWSVVFKVGVALVFVE